MIKKILKNNIFFYIIVLRIEVEFMNKKGFSLSELLVVIAIIAVITIIAVPSIITINKNINKRMYNLN